MLLLLVATSGANANSTWEVNIRYFLDFDLLSDCQCYNTTGKLTSGIRGLMPDVSQCPPVAQPSYDGHENVVERVPLVVSFDRHLEIDVDNLRVRGMAR
jgi:hypothetical protein